MADEKELIEAADAASQEAAPDGASQEAGDEGQDRQLDLQQEIDLDSLPAFRKWKSQMDKRLAQMEKSMSASERRAYEAEQRLHQQRMEGMSELERANYQVQYLQEQLQQMQRLRELDAFAFQKEQDIRHVAAKKGLSYEELAEALPQDANAMVLWEIAEEMASRKQAEAKDKPVRKAAQPNNKVDLGGGKPAPKVNEYQAAYDAARKEFDVNKMLQVKEEALRQGVFVR